MPEKAPCCRTATLDVCARRWHAARQPFFASPMTSTPLSDLAETAPALRLLTDAGRSRALRPRLDPALDACAARDRATRDHRGGAGDRALGRRERCCARAVGRAHGPVGWRGRGERRARRELRAHEPRARLQRGRPHADRAARHRPRGGAQGRARARPRVPGRFRRARFVFDRRQYLDQCGRHPRDPLRQHARVDRWAQARHGDRRAARTQPRPDQEFVRLRPAPARDRRRGHARLRRRSDAAADRSAAAVAGDGVRGGGNGIAHARVRGLPLAPRR